MYSASSPTKPLAYLLTLLGPAGAFVTSAQAEWTVAQGRLTAEATATSMYMSNAEARRNGAEAFTFSFAPALDYKRQSALIETSATAGVEFEHVLDGPGSDREAKRAGLTFSTAKSAGYRFTPTLRTLYTESYSNDLNVNARIFNRQTTTAAGGEMTFSPTLAGALTSTYETNRADGYAGRHSLENKGRLESALGGRRSLFAEVNHREVASDDRSAGSTALDQRALSTTLGFTQGFSTGTKASIGVGYLDQQRSTAETLLRSKGSSGATVMASIDGPFLPPTLFPKLTSMIRLAFGRLENPGLQDNGNKQLTGEVAVGWAARSTTRLGLAAARTRDLTVNDLTMERSRSVATVEQSVGNTSRLAGTLGYEWMTIRGIIRHSEGAIATFSASRKLGSRDRWESRFNYEYRDLNSSEQVANFSQHTVRLSAIYRL